MASRISSAVKSSADWRARAVGILGVVDQLGRAAIGDRPDWRYVLLRTIRRWIGLSRQPPSTSVLASQSSKSGGGSGGRPWCRSRWPSSGDQPGARVVLPDPVGQDPRREQHAWGRLASGPGESGVGHVQGELGEVVGHQDAGRSRADEVALALPNASFQDVDLGALWRSRSSCPGWSAQGSGERSSEGRDLLLQLQSCLALRRLGSLLEGLQLLLCILPFVASVASAFSAGGGEDNVVLLGRREVRLKPVVVLLRDRFELVVVASGTADGEAEDRGPEDVRAIGQDLVAAQGDLGVTRVPTDWAEPVEKVEATWRSGSSSGASLIPGDLLDQEAIEWLVIVRARSIT